MIKAYVIITIIIVIIDNDYYRDYHDNYCLHKQPTQKKHVTPHQNHSYEEIRAIIDAETSAASESALSVSKSKIATEIWTYIRPLRSNEPERKGNSQILYCKHCPLETSYGSPVTTTFRHHFASRYNIIIEKRQNTILIIVSDDFDRLYKRLCESGQIEEVETKIIEKVLYKEIINEILVLLVVVRNFPFLFIEWPEFHILFISVNPQVAGHFITTYSTIS